MKSMSELSHQFLKPALHKQAVCIDGTLGYGRDAGFFLEQGAKRVYAYEIQPNVLTAALDNLPDLRLHVLAKSHGQMGLDLGFLQEKVDAVIFNFGYDPHTLEGIATTTDSSLAAIQAAAALLRIKGRMALVFYPHPQGVQEKEAIFKWLEMQPYLETTYVCHPFKQNSPSLLCVEKRHKA